MFIFSSKISLCILVNLISNLVQKNIRPHIINPCFFIVNSKEAASVTSRKGRHARSLSLKRFSGQMIVEYWSSVLSPKNKNVFRNKTIWWANWALGFDRGTAGFFVRIGSDPGLSWESPQYDWRSGSIKLVLKKEQHNGVNKVRTLLHLLLSCSILLVYLG